MKSVAMGTELRARQSRKDLGRSLEPPARGCFQHSVLLQATLLLLLLLLRADKSVTTPRVIT
jgi:hypothetical protein